MLGLGSEYQIGVFDAESSGYVLDMGHVTAKPGEEYGTYLFPGTSLRLSLLKGEEDPETHGVEVVMGALPDGAGTFQPDHRDRRVPDQRRRSNRTGARRRDPDVGERLSGHALAATATA